jgi:arsenate reductase-like glutaredoxin family protein
MNIILYGTKKCQDTRKAERFLKERKNDFQFRDVSDKPLSEDCTSRTLRRSVFDEGQRKAFGRSSRSAKLNGRK